MILPGKRKNDGRRTLLHPVCSLLFTRDFASTTASFFWSGAPPFIRCEATKHEVNVTAHECSRIEGLGVVRTQRVLPEHGQQRHAVGFREEFDVIARP